MTTKLGSLGAAVLLAGTALAAERTLRTLRVGNHSGIRQPERVVARNQEEWEALWRRSLPVKDPRARPPRVDWSREMVLGVFLGSKPTGGYSVRIRNVREVAGKLRVEVEVRRPPRDGFVTQGFTSPFHLVAAPKSTLPVEWTQ
jgi:hypothetical protein